MPAAARLRRGLTRLALASFLLSAPTVWIPRAYAQEPPPDGEPEDSAGDASPLGAPVSQPPVPGEDEPLPSPPTNLGIRNLDPLPPSPRLDLGGGDPLSIDELIASVRAHYPPLLAERERVRAAEASRLEADGAFDLGVSADVKVLSSYYDYVTAGVQLSQPTGLWGLRFYGGWRLGTGLDPEGVGEVDGEYLGQGSLPSYYGELETLGAGEVRGGVVLPLWRGGPIDPARAGVRQARQALRAARAGLTGRRLDVEQAAVAAYWDWVAAGQLYAIGARLLDLAEERNGQIERMVDRGSRAFIELLENRRAILARRQSLVADRRRLEAASIRLSLFLRRNDGRPRLPSPSRLPPGLPLPVLGPLPDRREAIGRALEQRPEIARFRALLTRQQVGVELAENLAAPRIDVKLEAAQDLGEAEADQDDRLRPFEVSGTVMFETPLQRRALLGRRDQAAANLRELEAEARFARDQVVARLLDAASAYEAARDRYEAAAPSAEVAEQVAEAERRRYDLGSSELLLVNLREQIAAGAAVERAQAQAAVFQAVAAYRTALGAAPAGSSLALQDAEPPAEPASPGQ
jgi:outer membrane protein TolC